MNHHPRMVEAEKLGRALMRGNRATLKTGYTYMNACLAAAEYHGITDISAVGLAARQHLLAYLFGYACGMEPHGGGDDEAWRHSGRRQGMRAFGSQYLESFDRGYDLGRAPDPAHIQPAGLSFEED